MICCNQLFHFTIFSVLLQYFPRNSYNFIRKTLDFRTSILILFLLLLAVHHKKGWDKSPSLSIIFGLSSKTQWLSGLYYADFISFYSPTQLCGGGTTKSNSNELPISVPLSFLIYSRFPISSCVLLEYHHHVHGCKHCGRRLFRPFELRIQLLLLQELH